MNWTNIKKRAKDKGYKVSREKSGDENNPYNYEWNLISDSSRNGTTNSLSQIAMAVYNDITDNKHIEHQERYRQQKIQQQIEYNSWGA